MSCSGLEDRRAVSDSMDILEAVEMKTISAIAD